MALSAKQRIAINLLVYERKRKGEVAELLDINPNTLTRWFSDNEFNLEYRKTVEEKISSISSTAINRIEELMYSSSDAVALNAAKDIASRAGLDAPTKQDISVDGLVINIDYGDD